MKELSLELLNSESPEDGDNALFSNTTNLGEYPMTPAAYHWLRLEGVNINIGVVYLYIVNKAEDQGKQLTLEEIKTDIQNIKQRIQQLEDQSRKLAAIEGGVKDVVEDIEVLHDPRPGEKAGISIYVKTRLGFFVHIKTIRGNLDSKKVSDKKKMTKDFFVPLIGKKLEFLRSGTVKHDSDDHFKPTEKRYFLRLKPGSLPQEYKHLDYAELKRFSKEKVQKHIK